MSTGDEKFLPFLRGFLRRRDPLTTLMLALGAVIPIGFGLYTNEVWEDFFITYRYSENLVRGHGLVFSPGERVHGFTSVLNTLLPALFAWLTQARDYLLPLFLYRVVSLAGLLLALVSVSSVVGDDTEPVRWRWQLCALFPLLAVLEIKTTAFAMNGQEAGLMLGFLAPAFVLAYRGWPRGDAYLGGGLLAGLMYVRPDGFVYALAIAAGAAAFGRTPWRTFAESFARSVAIGIVLYLPWLIFAQGYYGSFIPHTIVAKNGTEFATAPAFGLLAPVAAGFAKLPERLCGALAAVYDFQNPGPGTWPTWLRDAALVLEGAAVTYWLVPTRDRLGRMASLCSMLIVGYLTYASLIAYSCPWYYPPLAFLSLLALVRMAVMLPGYLGPKAAGVVSVTLMAAMLSFLVFIFSFSLRALRLKQDVIDGDLRRNLGLWLKANVPDRETVYLEPLGYIGYFSQRKMRDWPGLVSPEVVAARRKIGHPAYPWGNYLWAKVAEEIKPDWIVARPVEVDQMNASPSLTRDYQLVKVFNASAAIIAAGEFYGSSITYNDAVFEIFRRRRTADGR